MRGMAAMYVLAYHFAVLGHLLVIPLLQSFQQAGWTGVDFFFVLSGYLLYSLYRNGFGKSYFIRRVFRTFPLYYLSIPLYVISGLIVFSPLYFLYAQEYLPSIFANVPLWTLTLEELFYFALLPLIIYAKPNRTALLVVSALMCIVWGAIVPQTDFATKQMPAWFVDYAIGIWLVDRKIAWKIAAPASIIIVIVGTLFYAGHDLWPYSPIVFGAGYGLMLIAFKGSVIFTNKISVVLGKISYGIYILQYPLMVLLNPILGAISCIGLAFLSYYLFESRLVRYAHTRF